MRLPVIYADGDLVAGSDEDTSGVFFLISTGLVSGSESDTSGIFFSFSIGLDSI